MIYKRYVDVKMPDGNYSSHDSSTWRNRIMVMNIRGID